MDDPQRVIDLEIVTRGDQVSEWGTGRKARGLFDESYDVENER